MDVASSIVLQKRFRAYVIIAERMGIASGFEDLSPVPCM
jgi:hypothetical protein